MERDLMQAADWADRWKEGKTGWHQEAINPLLLAHYDQWIGNRQHLKIFQPLCGKSVDIKWLYDKGHTVWGVDIAEEAMIAFFTSYSMRFTKAPLGNFQVFQNEDKRINLILGDYFALSSEIIGQFDAVWDRASFVAVNPGDRKRYVATVLSLLKPSALYLLDTLHYDPSKWPGPPHDVTENDIATYFGPHFNVNYLGTMSAMEDKHRNEWGLDFLDESAYLLTMKTN